MFPYSHPIEIRFRDCDALRHVNHAVYITYCEQARFGYWKHLTGADALKLHEVRFLVVRAECDYRSPATLGDPLVVRVRTAAIGRSSFTLEYEMANPDDGRVYAEAKTVLVMVEAGTWKPTRVPEDIRALLEKGRQG